MDYVIVTPAKDEEGYIENILSSVVRQEVLPSEWIIVDDGSEDNTRKIALRYAEKYPWIKVIPSAKEEKRGEGAPIIRTFYVGYRNISVKEWDFIVKLDADLTLPKDYFKSIIETFQSDPQIGLAGGYCVTFKNGVKKRENHASYHIRGPIKSIRRECWEDIEGFQAVWGWDGLDEMTAMYHGWKTQNIEKEVIHHRPTTSDYNQMDLAYKKGYSKYKNGSDFPLVLIRALKRLNKKPYFLFSYNYVKGYLNARSRGEEKNVSNEFAKFINKFHYKRIFK